jgi:carbon starvation protein
VQSVAIVLLGIGGMLFGWFVYAKFIATKIYRLDPDFVTPAHEINDGVDYVPTKKFILRGHHFTSVAGAAPIVGPAIAVYWGWVPAVLWVTLGTVFFAGVHDFGAIWASARNKGQSIGALSATVVGGRTRALFMIIVFLVLLMVNAVFSVVIAGLFVESPSAVFPAWAAIAVALIVGQLLHRNFNLTLVSTAAVAALYGSIYVGSQLPIVLPDQWLGVPAAGTWIVVLFVYAGFASTLPVWVLLQPRDFINGLQLIIGLLLLYGAVFLALPDVSAPAFNSLTDGAPSMVPLLFVTIACGAVSGFHGIVSSGTTSKQLDRETDAKFVGYLGAVGEGALALVTIVAVSGAALAATPAAWHAIYDEYGSAGASTFVLGGAQLIRDGWGLPLDVATAMLATMVVLFAATTMDTGIRLQRYIIQEWGEIYSLPALRSGVIATLVAIACCMLLAFGAGGGSGAGGLTIWPLFGSTNQILAALTLLVISVMLIKLGRPARYTLVPMIFVLVTSAWAAILKLIEWYQAGDWLLVTIDIVVLVISVLVILEAASAVFRHRRTAALSGGMS